MAPSNRPSGAVRAAAVAPLLAALVGHARPAGAQGGAPAVAPNAVGAAARGDSAWTAGAREAARRAYAVAVAGEGAPSSRTVYRLGVLESERNNLPTAIALHERYTRMEPRDQAGYVALARVLSWDGRYGDAVRVYDHLLAVDSTDREAALGRAQTLAWASRFDESVAQYERWLAAYPGDGRAALDLARTLSWAGRLDAAEARYQAIAAAGGSPDAEKGIARVAAWRGDLVASERLWRSITARYPRDPEGWTGLAQVLRWTGRPGMAEDALRTALAAEPSYGDARTQLRWVDGELAASAEPVAVLTTDSDRNRSTYYGVTASARAPWTGRLLFTGSWREAELQRTSGRSLGARAVASWSGYAGRVGVRGELGGARLTSDTGGVPARSASVVAAGLRATAQPHARLTVGAGVGRSPFDETATLIARAIRTTTVDGEASLALPLRTTLSGGAGVATIAGGSVANRRTSASAALRSTIRRGLSVGVAARRFGYDTTARGDGYFAPRAFLLVEGSAHAEVGRDLGWAGSLDAGLGRQRIRFTPDAEPRANLAERVAAGVSYRFAPGVEWGASYGFANVAAPGTLQAAEYRAHSFTLRARLHR